MRIDGYTIKELANYHFVHNAIELYNVTDKTEKHGKLGILREISYHSRKSRNPLFRFAKKILYEKIKES
jgi:hypothetical protein